MTRHPGNALDFTSFNSLKFISSSRVSLLSALMDSVVRAEHMATIAATICSSNAAMSKAALEEVSSIVMNKNNSHRSNGFGNIGKFIEAFATCSSNSSSLLAAQLPLLLKLLNCDAFQIRFKSNIFIQL
jgi:hypothetical protein